MRPYDLSKYVTETHLEPWSLGLAPASLTVTGYWDNQEALAQLLPDEPVHVTYRPYRRWWQFWKRRRSWSVLATITGITETAKGLTVTFQPVEEER